MAASLTQVDDCLLDDYERTLFNCIRNLGWGVVPVITAPVCLEPPTLSKFKLSKPEKKMLTEFRTLRLRGINTLFNIQVADGCPQGFEVAEEMPIGTVVRKIKLT